MANYRITIDKEEILIDKQAVEKIDISSINDTHFHVLKNTKSYNVELISSNFLEKEVTIALNGNTHVLKIEDSYDQMVKEMGLFSNASQKLNNVKAPMPGLIIDILVKVGQKIKEGTPLLILSAMKMENIILSQGEGTITSIGVKKEDAVDKGQIIIEVE